MRPRTPTAIWIPFVFSVEALSWAMLIASLALFAALLLGPSLHSLKAAQTQRNDVQATLDLLDQKIALQSQFIRAAGTDPLLMERLASRQFNLNRPDQQVLVLDPHKHDHSIAGLIDQALSPVTPAAVAPLPWWLTKTLVPALRPMLLMMAITGLVLSFLLGVRYQRR